MIATWTIKLVLAHLLTDFILQPKSWVTDRANRHFGSSRLYVHGLLTGLVAWILMGFQYWLQAVIILISHILIDAWKSYQRSTMRIFLADQLLHLLVIAGCCYFTFIQWPQVLAAWNRLNSRQELWKTITAFVFVTAPAGIIIGQFTRPWREQIAGGEQLANAGKWIGITERIIILLFVMANQYSAVGLLVAAKGIIRFNEKDRQEIKTEYLVTGTLMSIALAVLTGILIKPA